MGIGDLAGDFFTDIDIVFLIKFILIVGIFVILPVWVFNFVEIGLMMKFMFTIGGAGGAWFALQGKSMRFHR